ncbi:hypothetical protein [Mucilaginibacter gossypii]|uniref:hypothetical protein n=1 Tax=Mucilaginibacter gossypii TaxID=551996 RepID=UPI00115FD301|nr:hypothetical protein [Mucilaginibacter gossypii]
MKKNIFLIFLCFLLMHYGNVTAQQNTKPRFKAIALAEIGGGHASFDTTAKIWLNKLAIDSNVTIDYISDTKKTNKEFLKQYQLLLSSTPLQYHYSNPLLI